MGRLTRSHPRPLPHIGNRGRHNRDSQPWSSQTWLQRWSSLTWFTTVAVTSVVHNPAVVTIMVVTPLSSHRHIVAVTPSSPQRYRDLGLRSVGRGLVPPPGSNAWELRSVVWRRALAGVVGRGICKDFEATGMTPAPTAPRRRAAACEMSITRLRRSERLDRAANRPQKSSPDGTKNLGLGTLEHCCRLLNRQERSRAHCSFALFPSRRDADECGTWHRKIRPDDADLRGRGRATSVPRRPGTSTVFGDHRVVQVTSRAGLSSRRPR